MSLTMNLNQPLHRCEKSGDAEQDQELKARSHSKQRKRTRSLLTIIPRVAESA